tara:strand:+ start:16 stop:246 length:231 start_codon:yes stop_codon:yes gene_type:complete
MFGLKIKNPKSLFLKILIVFLPIYLIAYFTQNMVYVLPSLAAGIILGNSINDESKIDSDDSDDGESDDGASESSDA